VVTAVVLAVVLWPAKGSLVVTVAAQDDQPLEGVEVLLDGKPVCDRPLCRVADLNAGTHLVQARAKGYPPAAEMAISISAGQEAIHNITLARVGGAGLKVSAAGTGFKLYVDGKEAGSLPKDISDLTPGEHVIKVVGSERYAPYEQRVTLKPNQVQTIGPLRLKVVKGLAIIKAGDAAENATVTLESGSEQRTLPSLPIRLDIPSSDIEHTLVATKEGFVTFRQRIEFEDGAAEKNFVITMVKEGPATAPTAAPVPPLVAPAAPGPKAPPAPKPVAPTKAVAPKPAAPKAPPPKPAAQTGTGTLNINSIPLSNVILDGRALGTTPKIGLSVPAGQHTVVFVKGDERKSATVDVPAGGTKTVSVRF
jgi:serine/threonine-protein kinase